MIRQLSATQLPGFRIWTSPDGATWTERTLSGQQWCGGIAHGNGRFVCVGGCGSTLVSEDGTSWAAGGDVSSGCNHLRSLAFGAGVFVALGDLGIAYSSPDGESWQAGESLDAQGVVFRDGEFRANGIDFYLATARRGRRTPVKPTPKRTASASGCAACGRARSSARAPAPAGTTCSTTTATRSRPLHSAAEPSRLH